MRRLLASFAICLFIVVIAAPFALAADRKDDCEKLVNKCVSLFQAKGRDYAVKAVNDTRAFCDKELYVFVFDFDNVCLAHPYKPSLVGKDLKNLKDTDGKLIAKEFKAVAEGPGAGWVEYRWLRPGEVTPRFKRTLIRRVSGQDIYVGAGYYPLGDAKSPVVSKKN